MSSAPKPVISVQVRELIEFVLRTGDLGGERDFVGPNRALAGTRGHQRVQRSRPEGYQKEVRVACDVEADEFILRVQGRIDGILATGSEVLLEEIKTVQGRRVPEADPLHWAQAKVYGSIYAQNKALPEVTLRLTYVELESGRLTEFIHQFSAGELSHFFTSTTAVYMDWIREHHHWGKQRDQSIASLAFPFQRYRPGQRELAVATYRAIAREQRLFVEAPTGIGKTISVLFPAIKSLAERKIERIFYLTARNTGQAVAEKAWTDLRKAGLHVRTLTLTAKEKICVTQGKPCDPGLCPLGRGYYDRRKPAMRAALAHEEITRSVLESVGQEHQVCPFELSLDLSWWVDAVVCDYNYLFDPKACLRQHFADETGSYLFLVDEAHNLVDRARAMFSAEISAAEIQQVRRSVQQALPRCARSLSTLNSVLRKLCASECQSGESSSELAFEEQRPGSWNHPLPPALKGPESKERPIQQRTQCDLPAELLPVLKKTLKQIEDWLIQNEATDFRSSLLDLYFNLAAFGRVAERYNESYRTILTLGVWCRMKLFCLDPSFFIRQALCKGKAAALFSATLAPMGYYRDLLGGSPEDPTLQVPSPFPPENLAILVHDRLRTDFKSRRATLSDVVDCVGDFVQERRGNYLVYLPSYEYLTALQTVFQARYPAIAVLIQRPGMEDAERREFLASFTCDARCTQVGFAVMGGIFGEGIDLVGDRLIGAVVVGVGLPQLSVERDLIREYFQGKIGAGFDYAYRFPGMNRVLQATGRVIRSDSDRGAVLLIDTRFGEQPYFQLLTRCWRPVRVRTRTHVGLAVRQFWEATGQP